MHQLPEPLVYTERMAMYYLRSMGYPIVNGRNLSDLETEDGRVAIEVKYAQKVSRNWRIEFSWRQATKGISADVVVMMQDIGRFEGDYAQPIKYCIVPVGVINFIGEHGNVAVSSGLVRYNKYRDNFRLLNTFVKPSLNYDDRLAASKMYAALFQDRELNIGRRA